MLDLMTPQDLKYVVCTTPPRFCGGFNAKCGNTHHYRSRMELCNPILTLLDHNVVTSCLKKYSFFQEILYKILLKVRVACLEIQAKSSKYMHFRSSSHEYWKIHDS